MPPGPTMPMCEWWRRLGPVIDKHKMKKHFALDIADGRFTFHRRQEEIAAEARLDGIYVIRTSLPADKIGSQAAVAAYKNLALVERAFRTLKGVDLQVRPVHHWLEHRVKAHVFLCMLAYYVEHHMRNALAPILLLIISQRPASAPRSWRRHSHPPRQSRNAPSGALSTGPQFMAWHDLIGQLGTLTINEVALPLGERRTIQMLPAQRPCRNRPSPARCDASSCPVADRTSEKECESDQPVRRVPSEKFGLAGSPFAIPL